MIPRGSKGFSLEHAFDIETKQSRAHTHNCLLYQILIYQANTSPALNQYRARYWTMMDHQHYPEPSEVIQTIQS